MRLKLTLSLLLVAIIAIASVVLLAGQRATTEVRAYMLRGGIFGLDPMVADLEAYYAYHHTWEGVETLLSRPRGHNAGGMGHGPGGMNPPLQLLDAEGYLLVDTSDPDAPLIQISASELQATIPLRVDGRVVGYLRPVVSLRIIPGDETQLLTRLYNAAWTAIPIAALLALLLALLLASRLLRPIHALTQAAHRMAEGDLGQRVPIHGNDELALLGRAFNHMAESLQQAETRRKALTADIAHELRTPLAVQRAHLEALQDGIYPLTPENLLPIAESNALLTRLVEDLRTLALADAGQLHLERVPTDLCALLQRLVERFAPAAEARAIQITLSDENPCPPISADPARIEQILGNLLTNALRHTPHGGHIHLSIEPAPQQIAIRIADSGPGIPLADLPHIFERFYRADKSRARSEGGTGLGLTIARQLARAHGGDLHAENAPAGGAIFTLTLPRAVEEGRQTTDDRPQTTGDRRQTTDHRR